MKKNMKFAAYSQDINNLLNSSSGGIFYEMAQEMIRRGGIVAGVIMDGLKTRYVLTDDLDVIKKMRGSKYIPSNPAKIIEKIKNCKKQILFTGLPCHIEAIKKKCDTSNIILCDLRCHGLPKNGIFERHMEKVSKGRDIKSIQFRDKSAGWGNREISYSLIVRFSNGDIYDNFDQYLIDYLDNKTLRENCKTCTKQNTGDITIGDFWNVPPKLKNRMGTSIVILNTKKGYDFFIQIPTITKKKARWYHYLNLQNIAVGIYAKMQRAGMSKLLLILRRTIK